MQVAQGRLRPSCQPTRTRLSAKFASVWGSAIIPTLFSVINKTASSLYSLIADGQYRATSLGRNTWQSLAGSQASLQSNCNMEGFNEHWGWLYTFQSKNRYPWKPRSNCATCDSTFGFGTEGKHDVSNTCDKEAVFLPDYGDKHIKPMGYILVQWRSFVCFPTSCSREIS